MIPPKNKNNNSSGFADAFNQSFGGGDNSQSDNTDTQVQAQPKTNDSDFAKAFQSSFAPEKKNGGNESNSNAPSSSQNNGIPLVGNPDFKEPSNFTTGSDVFPLNGNSIQNIPQGLPNSNPIVPQNKFTPNLSNSFNFKSASALAEKMPQIKDATQVAMLPVLNRQNVLGQNNGTYQEGEDEGVKLADDYKSNVEQIKNSPTDYATFNQLVGSNQNVNNNQQIGNVATSKNVGTSSINYNIQNKNNPNIKELQPESKYLNEDLSTGIIQNRLDQLKEQTITKAGMYANKIGSNATNAGLITRAILGDQNALQQSRQIKEGNPVSPVDMFYNDQQGLDAQSKGLDTQYASDLNNPDYISKKKDIQNQQAVLIDKYPEFKQQQLAKIVAQQIIKDHPSPDSMMLLPYGLAAAKELGLSDSDIKSIDFDNLPIQSPLSTAAGAVYKSVIDLGAGAARILGSAVGINKDFLDSELGDATRKAQQRFEDVSGLENSPTVVDANKTSPTYLQDIANPNSGKYNYNFHTISNAIGNGIGNLVQFVGGTKLLGGIATDIVPSLSEAAATDAGMAGLMVGQGYEPYYQKARQTISDKPEDEWKRHGYALINGLLDYYSFKGLGKVVQNLNPSITNDLEGVFKDAPNMASLNKNALTNATTKIINGIKETVGETAFVGGAQASADVAKNIVDNVVGNPDAVKKSNAELGNVLLNGIENLPFALMIPIGASKLISGAQHSYLSNENIYNAGISPESYLGQSAKLLDDGIITQDEYSGRAQVVNTATKVVNSIPDNLNLNHNQRVAYTNSKIRELALKAQSENIDDAALEKFYSDKIDEEVQNRTDIINGGSKEPSYITPTSSIKTNINESDQKSSSQENGNETVRGQQNGQSGGQENNGEDVQKEVVPNEGAGNQTVPSSTTGLSHGDWLDKNKDLFTPEKYRELSDGLTSNDEKVKQNAVDEIVAKKQEQKGVSEVSQPTEITKDEKDVIDSYRNKLGVSEDEVSDNEVLKEVAEQSFNISGGKKNTNAGKTDLQSQAENKYGKPLVDIAQRVFPEKDLLNSEPQTEQSIPNKVQEQLPTDVGKVENVSDADHAQNIKDAFRKEFKAKGISDEQISGATALMDARAKSWASEEKERTPEQWFRQIADVKNGEFQTGDVKYQGGKLKATLLGAASMLHPLETREVKPIESNGRMIEKTSDAGVTNKPIIKITDDRKIDAITGKSITDRNSMSANNVDVPVVKEIVREANAQGVDPYTALAIAYQETHLSNADKENPFRIRYDEFLGVPKNEVIENSIGILADKLNTGKEHGGDEANQIQAYNGYGKIGKHTEGEQRSLYGIDVSKHPIDTKENPVYGKRVIDIRDNILKKNPELVKLVESEKKNVAYQQENGIKHGAVETLADGRKVIHALDSPDFSTMVHEIAHVFEGDLTPEELKIHKDFGGSEAFARGFENYLREGKSPTPELKTLFDKFKDWLTNIYQSLKGSPIEKKLSPEIKQVFDRLLTEKSKEEAPIENHPEIKKLKEQRDEELDKVSKPDVKLNFVDKDDSRLDKPTGKKIIVKTESGRKMKVDETFKDVQDEIIEKRNKLEKVINCLWG